MSLPPKLYQQSPLHVVGSTHRHVAPGKVVCQQCGGKMRKTKRDDHDYGLQFVGVALFFAGLIVLFIAPFGALIGLAMIVGAMFMGFKRQKVWSCNNCGYFFQRK